MHKELYQRTFGDILKAAVEENLMASLETIPSNEVLQAEYVPSSVLWNRIRKIVRKDHRRTLWRKAMQSTKKVAILLAIIIPVSLGSLLSVEASRTAILNFIFNWKSDHVDIHFQQAGSSPSAQSPQNAAIPEYLPSGFIKTREVKVGPLHRLTYQNSSKESIVFDQVPLAKAGTLVIDSEHTNYREITINGQKASLFAAKTADDSTFILWRSRQTAFLIRSKINQNELIRIAESVK